MSHPDVDQRLAALRDLERALAGPLRSPLAPTWADRIAVDQTALFDPVTGPLYDKATRVQQLYRQHENSGRVEQHWPLLPDVGTSRFDRSRGDEPLAVFAADVTDTDARAYVVSDVPIGHTGAIEDTLGDEVPDAPADVDLDNDGRLTLRLSDRLTNTFVHGPGGSVDLVSAPEVLASPAQLLRWRIAYGTTSPRTCDFKLTEGCGGTTALILQHGGLRVWIWSTCQSCFTHARDAFEAAHAEEVAKARRRVGLEPPNTGPAELTERNPR